MNNSLLTEGTVCSVCGQYVKLEASESNERGKPMHSECAVRTVREQPRDQDES